MKIRNGFVSNSSSSSFVVAFPEKPKNAEHVREMMFGKELDIRSAYGEEIYTTQQIAETVFNDIQKQKENDIENIIEGFNGWLDGSPDFEYIKDESREEYSKRYQKYLEEDKEYRTEVAQAFIDANKNAFIYTFEYSDEDGEYGSTLEHGDIFYKLKYRWISRH